MVMLAPLLASLAAVHQPGPQIAAKYVAKWTSPPSGIGSGRLSGAPVLGNGDLGVSVGGHLPGKPQPQPPPGGRFVVGHAPCNASDVRQHWAGRALSTAGGGIVSAITNRGAPVGQCLSTFDLRPLTMRTCGDGDTMWIYNASTLILAAAPTSTNAGRCLNADSASSPIRPNQPGWVALGSCGPKCEQYTYAPVGSSGAGLLQPQCPPAVRPWNCPGLKGHCLAVHSNSAPPPSPILPSAAAAGALTLNFGANQMWGLREYNRCMFQSNSSLNKPGCIHFDTDTTFPRRLGLGGLTVSPSNHSALAAKAASFSAEMHIATAEVRAALTSPTTGTSLRIHVILSPDENVALTTVTAEPPMEVTITSWALPLDISLKQPCTPTADPSAPGCLDGFVRAGVGAGRDGSVFWSQRQPLGASSTKPISIAMASTVVSQQEEGGNSSGGGGTRAKPLRCELISTSASACTYQVGPSGLQIATSVLSNLDLCPGHDDHPAGKQTAVCDVDPVNASITRAASVSPAAIVRANSAWWFRYWNTTSVSIPGDVMLERFYFAHSYLIGAASRAGRVAAGLWGPWVHDDSPAWGGDFTLDYNHEANHWGLYANNRLSQAQPQYAPLLAFIPKARAQAAFYICSGGGGGGCCPDGAVRCGDAPLCNSSSRSSNNSRSSSPCPGLHFPGHIAPFGFDATLAGEPWASMSDHSNGVFASLNMIQEWEYSRNTTFLRTVAFPFCRDTLLFYQSWMRRRVDGSWVNENDQANECTSDGTLAGVFDSCYQNNTVFSNGFIRRVASALPSMAKHLGEPVDPQWAEIALRLDPLPTVQTNGTNALPYAPPRPVIVLAGNYTNITSATDPPACRVTCGTRACGRSCPAQVAGDGMMDVMAWPVFPGEAVSLASPESLQQAIRNTLQLSAEWEQGNSFCSIFSQAARVRMPVEQWVPKWRAAIQKSEMTNMFVYQGGGGMEVAGALQAVADLMLQSVTQPGITGETYMALFPLNVSASDLSFHRLRGKGAFVVSARWNATSSRLDGPIRIESEVGGPCSLQLPPSQTADTLVVSELRSGGGGTLVPATRTEDGRWNFRTRAGETYSVSTTATSARYQHRVVKTGAKTTDK